MSFREELEQEIGMAFDASPAMLHISVGDRETTADDVLLATLALVTALKEAVLRLADEIDELRAHSNL